jgi:replicative DNA helicase
MNPVTIPEPPLTLTQLERHVWYADRLREADIPFNPGDEHLDSLYHGVYNGDYKPPPEPLPRPDKLQLERALDGAAFILHEPEQIPAVWGRADQVLWAEGEGLLLVGPDGVGKTTVAQQLVLARLGIADRLLNLPIQPAAGKVLYIAADRPRQAARSFARMVTSDHEELLRDRLVVWRGPLPFDPLKEQRGLADLTELLGATDIVVDSLKDIALDLTTDETGSRVNLAFQEIIARGLQLCALHHQRKEGRDGGGKPNRLADVYGSRWLTAGMGSVACLWGEPGDPIVELLHLKQPAEDVGPLQLIHDHAAGRTTVEGGTSAHDILEEHALPGLEVKRLAERLYKKNDPSRKDIERARRKLEGMVRSGQADRGTNISGQTVYRPVAA